MLKHFIVGSSVTAHLFGAALLAATVVQAQQAPAPQPKAAAPIAQTPIPKAGPGEKLCTHKFPDGTSRAWVCKEAEPCCTWDEIRYVKCGSPVFRCL